MEEALFFFSFLSLFTLPHERLEESFIHKKIFSLVDLTKDTEVLVAQLFGFYSALNAVSLIQHKLEEGSDFNL